MNYNDGELEVCIAKKYRVNENKTTVKFKPLYIKKNKNSVGFEKLEFKERLNLFPHKGLVFFLYRC